MTPVQFLEQLRRSPAYRDQLVACRRLPARPPRFGELERPLPEPLRALLAELGVGQLYSHQAAAIDAARAGMNVTVVTGTASGKTLCFNVPVVERLAEHAPARALYLYPTKALAQDQIGKLQPWSAVTPLRPATYDGDTPQEERRAIRRAARVVLTNPDMLHVSILPNHTFWSEFLARLEYVIVDEVHTYRGVFGSHVANILRRLRRLCAHYGSEPRFICASATIANPEEHVRRLTGLPSVLVADDGAPRGERWFALWNPPLVAPRSGERRSALVEAAWIFSEMAQAGLRNITFGRARVVAELILRYAQASLAADAPELVERVAAYRAGYTPAQRRRIEQQLFQGELLGVTATNALELGVDVGALDAAVLVGYPGTIASTWQQAGRAGRARRPSLAMLVALDDPLDQFLVRNPGYLLESPVEQATLHAQNPYILLRHAACAAAEKPLGPEDPGIFGAELEELVEVLTEAGQLRPVGDRFYWSGTGYPAADVHIRTAGGEPFWIRRSGDAPGAGTESPLLGTVDAETALRVVYPGAVYLHQGESYLVTDLDLESRTACVRPSGEPFYTRPRVQTTVRILERYDERVVGTAQAGFGQVEVTGQVLGYRKYQLQSERLLEQVDLQLPPRTYATEGLWVGLPSSVARGVTDGGGDLLGAIHAIEHAATSLGPLHAMCDRGDLGGASHPHHPDLGQAVIFLHDSHPGGVGIAARCFEVLDRLLGEALDAVARCPCEAGCPACIHSSTCGSGNEPLDKRGAVLVLQALLDRKGSPRRDAPL